MASADNRICERAIFTNAFSLSIHAEELGKLLESHGLTLNSSSDEIGKLNRVKVTPEILIKGYGPNVSLGMFASHAPMLLVCLAHQIELGHINPELGTAAHQIANLTYAVQRDMEPPRAVQPRAMPKP